MLYAVAVYDLNEDKLWEMIGYEIIFRDLEKAIVYAYKKTCNTPFFRYYGVKRMSETVARAGGLEDLIES